MAVGDVYIKAPASTADTAFCTFQPGAGVEIVIHNFAYEGAMELWFFDGTHPVKVDEDTSAGSRMGVFLHCNNTNYYEVKNVSGGTIFICADGIVTK